MSRRIVRTRGSAARPGFLAVVGAVLGTLSLVVGTGLATSGPASAAGTIDAQAIALASSASCRYGDVDITYAAAGVTDASVSFTSADGAVLDAYADAAYQSDYVGTEHVLTEADTPAVNGTILGVYVWVGTAPPSAATTGEFFVLYRCDGSSDSGGGANEVLETCVGPYGSCPRSADEALDPSTTTTTTTTTANDPTIDEGPESPTPEGVVIPRFAG
jgi:hypothetical protein